MISLPDYLFSGGLCWVETLPGNVGFISLWQCWGLPFVAGVPHPSISLRAWMLPPHKDSAVGYGPGTVFLGSVSVFGVCHEAKET